MLGKKQQEKVDDEKNMVQQKNDDNESKAENKAFPQFTKHGYRTWPYNESKADEIIDTLKVEKIKPELDIPKIKPSIATFSQSENKRRKEAERLRRKAEKIKQD